MNGLTAMCEWTTLLAVNVVRRQWFLPTRTVDLERNRSLYVAAIWSAPVHSPVLLIAPAAA
jgi:hypothetical protein